MVWRALALLALAAATASATKHHHATPRPKKLLGKVSSAPALLVWSADLAASRVTVVLGGVDRPPEARLFVFHDDRDRNFIALDAHCKAGLKKVVCDLDYPRPYLGAKVLTLTAKLHGRQVAANEAELAAVFDAAREAPGDDPAVNPAPLADRSSSSAAAAAGADRAATPAAVAPLEAGRAAPAARAKAAEAPARPAPARADPRSPDGGALDKP